MTRTDGIEGGGQCAFIKRLEKRSYLNDQHGRIDGIQHPPRQGHSLWGSKRRENETNEWNIREAVKGTHILDQIQVLHSQ